MRMVFVAMIILVSFIASAQTDFDIVKTRVLQEMRGQAYSPASVRKTVDSLDKEGTWPDINYQDVSRTGFQHSQHLDRIHEMALAISDENGSMFGDKQIREALNRALRHWLANDYQSENWWYNQVFTPKMLVVTLLLSGELISENSRKEALPIINRANLQASGARPGGDRIKFGTTQALSQLLRDDREGFAVAMKTINDELGFATGERGMQRDFSFHHRSDRVNNTTTYGQNHANLFAEWAGYVAGTRFAFTPDKQALLIDYYLDGISKQYVYGTYKENGVKNRDISRVEEFEPLSTETPKRLLTVSDYRADELKQLIALREGNGTPPAFAKFFWQTEHFVFQRPSFYVSVRMHSVRNSNMEAPYNGEGLRNHHRGDGAAYMVKKGDEYLNAWPVYDWQKIPGTTVSQKPRMPAPDDIRHYGLTSFVGAVTDGNYGGVGFDFISPHDHTRARKAWFFFEDRYLCLGAGIESANNESIVTTVEQNLLEGPVRIITKTADRKLLDSAYIGQDIREVIHNGTAYIFHEPTDITVERATRTGSWKDINKQWSSPSAPVTKDMFSLYIDHGARPQDGAGGLKFGSTAKKDVTYAYTVVPNYEEQNESPNNTVKIITNNRHLQAVEQEASGLTQIIAYRAGSVTLSDGTTLSFDSPAALQLRRLDDGNLRVTASDPSRFLTKLHLTLTSPNSPRSPKELVIDLPTGELAGSSVTMAYSP